MLNPKLSLRRLTAAAAFLALCVAALPAQADTTADTLALAPKQAQITLALPPLTESLDAYVAFIKKVAPDSNIEAELAEAVADLAAEANAGDATTLPAVFEARGLDPSQPIGAFLDFSRAAEAIKVAQKGGADETEESADAVADATEEATEEADEVEEEGVEFEFENQDWVILASVKDKAKVEELVKELASKNPEIDPTKAEEVETGGLKVTVNGAFGHFITDKHVAIGTKSLVLATAEGYSAPRPVRYGSKDVPANAHEIVALVYGERFFPILDEVLPTLEMDDAGRAVAQAQLTAMKDALKSEGEEDPLIITHTIYDNRGELKVRLDTATHPGYLKMTGPAQPLRLAPLLPDNALAFLTLRLNEEAKKQLMEQVIPALQESGEQAAAYALPAIQMIGDEITIGVAPVENDFPAAFIMIALAEPDAAKGLLNMLVPTMPAETYNEEQISAIAAPIPVPLQMATPGDILLISNNVDGMKKIIDMKKADQKGNLLGSLKDMIADRPRYQALVLKSALLSEVVIPLAALAGGLPPEVAPVADAVTKNIDEVRYVSEMQDDWAVTQLTAYLK